MPCFKEASQAKAPRRLSTCSVCLSSLSLISYSPSLFFFFLIFKKKMHKHSYNLKWNLYFLLIRPIIFLLVLQFNLQMSSYCVHKTCKFWRLLRFNAPRALTEHWAKVRLSPNKYKQYGFWFLIADNGFHQNLKQNHNLTTHAREGLTATQKEGIHEYKLYNL